MDVHIDKCSRREILKHFVGVHFRTIHDLQYDFASLRQIMVEGGEITTELDYETDINYTENRRTDLGQEDFNIIWKDEGISSFISFVIEVVGISIYNPLRSEESS